MSNLTSSKIETSHTISILECSYLLIFVFGIPGNILMFIVFSRKTFTKLSVSVYFRAMAIVNLYVSIVIVKKFLQLQFNFNIPDQSVFLCKGYYYVLDTVTSAAAWYLAAADIDRFVYIAFPTRFQFIQKTRFSLYVWLGITVYNMVFYAQFLVFENLVPIKNPATNQTYFKCYSSTRVLFFSDLINSVVIPFLIMISSTVGMFLVVRNSQKRMRKFQNSKETNKREKRNVKFVVSMIIINVAFLVLKIPNFVFTVSGLENSNNFLQTLISIMFYLFYAIEFYLQIAVNSLVRNEILSIFGRKRTKYGHSTTN